MRKMVIRIDDVGFTDVCNIGTFETIYNGVATSADVMLESPGTEDALRRLKDLPWISVGWHTHMWGTPVLPREKVPSLIEEGGQFDGRFRTDLQHAEDVNYDEAVAELRAQLTRCLDILGRVPDTAGGGRGNSPWARAMNDVVKEYGIATNFISKMGTDYRITQRIIKAKEQGEAWADYYVLGKPDSNTQIIYPDPKWADRKIMVGDGALPYLEVLTDSITAVEENYDPVKYYTEDWAGILQYPEDVIFGQAWHPGYMDYYVYRLGERARRPRARQFGVCRLEDVNGLCSQELRDWIKANKIELVTYRDALYGTSEYQNHLKAIGSDLCMI